VGKGAERAVPTHGGHASLCPPYGRMSGEQGVEQQSLKGKIAVVTGGSSGIGATTVRMLAAEGATVYVSYNKGRERAEKLIAGLPGSGHAPIRIVLEDSATMRDAAKTVGDAHGRVDILVNSAGFTKPVPHVDLEAMTDDLIDALMVANVRGPFAMIRAFAPLLKASRDGTVINVSSVSGFTGSGSSIAYCAAKAALDTMTMSLGRALGPEIRVLCVSPGAVNTDFVAGRGLPQLEKIAQATPLKKIVQPDDVARAILACVTHLKATTGAVIVCDGGRFLN
jgi:3-oxoacyl-[acyl-carrier protein] reductase